MCASPGGSGAVPRDRERLLTWLQVWLQVEADAALDWLEGALPLMAPEDADALVLHLAAALELHRGSSLRMDGPRCLDLKPAGRLLRFLHRHVRRAEDVVHHGIHTPGARDDAQGFRSAVFSAIANAPGPAAHRVLLDLADAPELAATKDVLTYYAWRRAQADAEVTPWTEAAVTEFQRTYTKPPQNAEDVYRLVLGLLADLRDDVENGDLAPIGLFSVSDNEERLQTWLAGTLQDRSRGHFEVLREAEGHNRVRPDIRVVRAPHHPLVIEVKWAHKDERTYANLRGALHDQLVGDYMKVRDARHGILFIGNLGNQRRQVPGKGLQGFRGVIEALREEVRQIMTTDPRGLELEVVGVQMVARDELAGEAL